MFLFRLMVIMFAVETMAFRAMLLDGSDYTPIRILCSWGAAILWAFTLCIMLHVVLIQWRHRNDGFPHYIDAAVARVLFPELHIEETDALNRAERATDA